MKLQINNNVLNAISRTGKSFDEFVIHHKKLLLFKFGKSEHPYHTKIDTGELLKGNLENVKLNDKAISDNLEYHVIFWGSTESEILSTYLAIILKQIY